MEEGNALKKTVHLYIKHKQKNLVNSGHRQDIVGKARTVNFTMKQENNRKKIRNTSNRTKNKNKKEFKEISQIFTNIRT